MIHAVEFASSNELLEVAFVEELSVVVGWDGAGGI